MFVHIRAIKDLISGNLEAIFSQCWIGSYSKLSEELAASSHTAMTCCCFFYIICGFNYQKLNWKIELHLPVKCFDCCPWGEACVRTEVRFLSPVVPCLVSVLHFDPHTQDVAGSLPQRANDFKKWLSINYINSFSASFHWTSENVQLLEPFRFCVNTMKLVNVQVNAVNVLLVL